MKGEGSASATTTESGAALGPRPSRAAGVEVEVSQPFPHWPRGWAGQVDTRATAFGGEGWSGLVGPSLHVLTLAFPSSLGAGCELGLPSADAGRRVEAPTRGLQASGAPYALPWSGTHSLPCIRLDGRSSKVRRPWAMDHLSSRSPGPLVVWRGMCFRNSLDGLSPPPLGPLSPESTGVSDVCKGLVPRRARASAPSGSSAGPAVSRSGRPGLSEAPPTPPETGRLSAARARAVCGFRAGGHPPEGYRAIPCARDGKKATRT